MFLKLHKTFNVVDTLKYIFGEVHKKIQLLGSDLV